MDYEANFGVKYILTCHAEFIMLKSVAGTLSLSVFQNQMLNPLTP